MESLLRQVLRKGSLPRINRLVDLGNAMSLRSVLPIASYDLDRVEGDIVIRFASGRETFVDLGSREVSNPAPGEVIYTDNREALSRRWNWRESDKAKTTPQTTHALLTVEGIGPIGREAVEEATRQLARWVEQYGGGTVSWHLLHQGHHSAEL